MIAYKLVLPFINLYTGNRTTVYSALSYPDAKQKTASQPFIVDNVANSFTHSDISAVISGWVDIISWWVFSVSYENLSKIVSTFGQAVLTGEVRIRHLFCIRTFILRWCSAHMKTQAALILLKLKECSSHKDMIEEELKDIHNQIIHFEKLLKTWLKNAKLKK